MELLVPGPPDAGNRLTTVRIGSVGTLGKAPGVILGAGPALVVADPEVLRLHPEIPGRLPVIATARGEAAKNLESLACLYAAFLEQGLDRASTIIAFGGGAICDLAGFAAATWLRGVDAVYVPTTLLAMVDAAVGGKTGIDFGDRKNLVGAFSAPRLVLMDVAFLDSLPDTEFASGMAEVIKHAVISGEGAFAFLESIAGQRPRASNPEGRILLERLVAESVAVKAGVVGRDPLEKGERRVLNLGHSYGHAFESILGLSHGQAVAAGLATAARLSVARRHLTEPALARVLALLKAFGLPSSAGEALALAAVPDKRAARARLAAALVDDKKRAGRDLLFALPRDIGKVDIVGIPLTELEAFLEEVP